MTATTTSTTAISTPARRSHPLVKATLVSGLVAAAATTTMAVAADAAGVPLAIDGEQIPFLGFAQMSLLGAVIGGLIVAALNRWSDRPRQRFEIVAVVLTLLSCVPSVALPP